jgi:hypothetical protein
MTTQLAALLAAMAIHLAHASVGPTDATGGSMTRVAIIGTAGGGKSTLGRWLSAARHPPRPHPLRPGARCSAGGAEEAPLVAALAGIVSPAQRSPAADSTAPSIEEIGGVLLCTSAQLMVN